MLTPFLTKDLIEYLELQMKLFFQGLPDEQERHRAETKPGDLEIKP